MADRDTGQNAGEQSRPLVDTSEADSADATTLEDLLASE